jgi:FkbM family methyltransferase
MNTSGSQVYQQSARAYWQLGRWADLAASGCGSSRRGSAKVRSSDIELLRFHVQSALQLGQREQAQEGLAALGKAGVDPKAQAQVVLSSAYNSLGRAWQVLGNIEAAGRSMQRSAAFYPELGDPQLVGEMRLMQQGRDLVDGGAPMRQTGGGPETKCLFIDCGGYDGCSALQFLIENPHFDCVSFEPNPELWQHYDDLPTQLVRKAAYVYDGEIRFTLDPFDSDGSSIIDGKRIDWEQRIANQDCPTITVPCIDLSGYIRKISREYDRIVLKLDVEGAEYDILERMLSEGTIGLIETLYCEFHLGKMDVTHERHERIIASVSAQVPVYDWDALPFSFTRKETKSIRIKRRNHLIRAIRRVRARSVLLP